MGRMPLCNLYQGCCFEVTFQGVAVVTHNANGKLHVRIYEHSQHMVATDLSTGTKDQAAVVDRIVEQG
jgi:hypothetical protein